MASIQEYHTTKGTFFEASVYLGLDPATGKQKNKRKKGFKTYRAAKLWSEKVRVDAREVGIDTTIQKQLGEKISFSELYEVWKETYIYTVKPSTYRRTTGIFDNHIIPKFGHMKLNKITTPMCQRAINEWRDTLVKYNNVFQYLNKILKYAADQELISKNPCTQVVKPIALNALSYTEEEDFENVWDKETLKAFLDACKNDKRPQIYPLFTLLAYTGIRRGELLALRWQDISFKEKTLSVRRAMTTDEKGHPIIGHPKNKSSARTISLDDSTINILKKWKTEQLAMYFALGYNVSGKDQLVFSSSKNTMLSAPVCLKWLRQICKTANIEPITIHGLRHTHCTLLIESGANIKEVQKRLGHSSIETTLKIYTHVFDKNKTKVVNQFAEYIAN